MTNEQIEISKSLGMITFIPGTFDKRFANDMYNKALNNPDEELTVKQNEWMYRILYKYRRQIPGIYQKYKDN